MEPEERTPTRIATEKAAEGLRLQVEGVDVKIDETLGSPQCLIYLTGFCMGIAEATQREQNQGEVDAMRVVDGGIIWALGGQEPDEFDRGNRIANDADRLFIRMQSGEAPELEPTYQFAVEEGQSFVTRSVRPSGYTYLYRMALRRTKLDLTRRPHGALGG